MKHGNTNSWRGSYRDLLVWQRAMQLGAEVYRLARTLPSHERFEMARQMRTAVFSIAANIAEGKGRTKDADFARFLAIARGSAYELNSCFDYARMLGYVPDTELLVAEGLLGEVGRMLTSMLRRLAPLSTATAKQQVPRTND
jgi:four helix bundle protein